MLRLASRPLACSLFVLALALEPAAAPAPPAAPDAVGPFDVGLASFFVSDPARGGRTLVVDVWYPVDAEDAVGLPAAYNLIFTALFSELAIHEPEPSSAGPFPLVVFSHGSGGARFQSFFLCEALASHGFVVVAPDHAGNTAFDLLGNSEDPFEVIAVNRPLDVSFLIDHMLARSADPADVFSGRVDGARIGVAGHSFGGYTSLVMAGGFATVPADARVRAIVPMAPASGILGDADLAAIEVPALILGGTEDTTTPIDPDSVRPYELISGRPLYRVDIVNADHFSFANICRIGDALIGLGIPPDLLDLVFDSFESTCGPERLPIDEAHRLINFYAISFLQTFVAGEPGYRRFLTEGPVARDDLPVDLLRRAGR